MLTGNHITVRYGEHTVVDELSFHLREGQWLMLAGPNGAGKSTLIEAIAQGVPYTGSVEWTGQDIRALKPAQLAQRIGILSQKNTVGYAYTVEEVVGLGRYAYKAGFLSGKDEDGTARVAQALQLTGLTELRHASMLTLSGGETQKLLLARALYRNAPVIVLDEPTAALDPVSENRLYETYDEVMQGKTTIFISHRLASTRFCHRIVLIDHGQIAEEGTHEELLAKKGRYYELFETQAKYYRENPEGEVDHDEA